MSELREKALTAASDMLGPTGAAMLDGAAASGIFGGHIGELALTNVFGDIWTREGLDRRSRSLVTLGILIALGAHDELSVHAVVAVRNGLSVEELAEIVYQASAYTGFPAASSARTVIHAALKSEGLIA